ncbi:MAG: hypothetical protein F6K09_34440 [Merismopedia sp. SIO2A8]|nr:hypothetical protein [Merismopedia sp. SIO2A8]
MPVAQRWWTSSATMHAYSSVVVHLNWVCIFLGFHSFGLYIHNDTLGRSSDMFSDQAIVLSPVFAGWIQAQLVEPCIEVQASMWSITYMLSRSMSQH